MRVDPLAPHMAEELGQALGHPGTLAYAPWPTYNEALTRDATIECRSRSMARCAAASPSRPTPLGPSLEAVALADPRVNELLAGHAPKKVVVVPGRLVSIVR